MGPSYAVQAITKIMLQQIISFAVFLNKQVINAILSWFSSEKAIKERQYIYSLLIWIWFWVMKKLDPIGISATYFSKSLQPKAGGFGMLIYAQDCVFFPHVLCTNSTV